MTRLYDVVVKKRHVQGQNVAVLEMNPSMRPVCRKSKRVRTSMCICPMVW